MNSLADFLNHRILPFVGRDADHRRIVEFWRGVFDARALRAMILFGEAGVGKTRLLESVVQTIVEARGSVVHVKLYPEAPSSFDTLVANALSHRDAGGGLFASEPEAASVPVGIAMQRLARLRPTMFILEDLHLLGPEAVPDLARLLAQLADESISVLALARPVELDARAALELYLIEEYTLRGLAREDCATIWEQVSGASLSAKVAEALHDATAGNPLALRSALREAFGSREGIHPNAANVLPATANAEALIRTMNRSVKLLADGMTAGLTPEELSAAKRIAMLGEVFSREAARALLGDDGPNVELLLFNGIIATAVAPPEPLPGPAGDTAPLAFAHTLLHRHLLVGAPFNADRLVRVVAASPLYSTIPFQLLSEHSWSAVELGFDTIERAFDRTIRTQIALNHSPQWARACYTWGTALRLLVCRMGQWDRASWERMLVRLVNHRLNMLRREPLEVRLWWLEYLERITSDISSDELAVGRIHALYHRDLLYSEGNSFVTRESWKEAEKLIAARPLLHHTFAYTDFVIAACVGANDNNDIEMLRFI